MTAVSAGRLYDTSETGRRRWIAFELFNPLQRFRFQDGRGPRNWDRRRAQSVEHASRERRSARAIRAICARLISAIVVFGIIVATAALAGVFDEPDSTPRRSENSANNYSRLDSSRWTRLMSKCKMDTIGASIQPRSRSFDGRW